MRPNVWSAITWIVISTAVALVGSLRIFGSEHQASAWHVDLHPYGYNEESSWRDSMNRVSVAFTSDRVLTLTYHIGSKDTLHAVFFDALTGERRATRDWSQASELLPTHDGAFLVRNNDGLSLFSSDLEPLRQLRVDCSHQRYGNWCFDVWLSPGGGAVFINQGTLESFVLRKLESDTLSQLGSWTSQQAFLGMGEIGRDSISQEKIVTTGNNFNPKSVYICDIDRPWPTASNSRSILVADPHWHEIFHVKRGLVGSPTFLNDEVLFLCGVHSVALLKTDGSVLLKDQAVRWPDYLVPKAEPSIDGRRVAVRIARLRPSLSDFPETYFIGAVVYDLRERKAVFKVDQKGAWSESVALSPGGTMLAVQHGSALDVFRTPE